MGEANQTPSGSQLNNSKTSQEPWKYVPGVYLKRADDATIPVEVQSIIRRKDPGLRHRSLRLGTLAFS